VVEFVRNEYRLILSTQYIRKTEYLQIWIQNFGLVTQRFNNLFFDTISKVIKIEAINIEEKLWIKL